MENLSTILWTKLNRFIGTEEQVLIRRNQHYVNNLIIATVSPVRASEYISSGSRAEGLNLPGSDVDVMYVCNQIPIFPSEYPYLPESYLVMETNNIKPGFVRLRVACNSNSQLQFGSFSVHNKQYVPSLTFRDAFVRSVQALCNNYSNVQDFVPHGPCATSLISGTETDILNCFSCPVWPNEASEWINRERPNNWPPTGLIEEIVTGGCLIVPIGNPHSPERHLEWRISFSVPERKLVHSMNHAQFLCYGFLKLYLKNVIESRGDMKGLLCSYFLKTCLFYCIEEENITWEKNNLLLCFWTCIKRLILWVRQGYCPSYFIRQNNMFEGKICGDSQKQLEKYLCALYDNGIATFRQIPCLSDLAEIMTVLLCNPGSLSREAAIGEIEREFFCDCELLHGPGFLSEQLHDITYLLFSLDVSRLQPVTFDSAVLDYIIVRSKIALTKYLYQYAYKRNRSNKVQYKLLTMCKNYIIQNCTHGNICTGWLQYATLCYLTGQYSKVVRIVEYILPRFKPFIMYEGLGCVNYIKELYMHEICGRGLTSLQKLKHATARSFKCLARTGFYPDDIEYEIRNHVVVDGIAFIPPVVYSNVLLFLSYKALGCVDLIDYILNELYFATNSTYFVSDMERSMSYALLEKCIYLARR